MAWTYSTMDGLSIHALCTTVQSELIRAVNERRECLGLATVDFKYDDGSSEKAYPSAADFDGFPMVDVTGSNDYGISDELQSNLGKLQDQIQGLLDGSYAPHDRFSTTSTGDTTYTVGSLETAVGLGAFPTTANVKNFRDANLWQRMQDALDLMIYVLAYVDSGDTTKDQYEDSGSGTTEERWDDAKADTPSSASGSGQFAEIIGWESTAAGVFILDDASKTFATSKYSGSITREVVRVYQEVDSMTSSVEFDVAGETITNTTSDGVSTSDHTVSGKFTTASDSIVTWSINTTPPASHPFDGVSNRYYGRSYVALRSMEAGESLVTTITRINIDISGELTDQA